MNKIEQRIAQIRLMSFVIENDETYFKKIQEWLAETSKPADVDRKLEYTALIAEFLKNGDDIELLRQLLEADSHDVVLLRYEMLIRAADADKALWPAVLRFITVSHVQYQFKKTDELQQEFNIDLSRPAPVRRRTYPWASPLSETRKQEIVAWLKDPAVELKFAADALTYNDEVQYAQGCIEGMEQGILQALAEQGISRAHAPERIVILLANLQRRERFIRKEKP